MENSINEILIKVMSIEQKQQKRSQKVSALQKHKMLTDQLAKSYEARTIGSGLNVNSSSLYAQRHNHIESMEKLVQMYPKRQLQKLELNK